MSDQKYIVIRHQCEFGEEDALYIEKLKNQNITFSMPIARSVTFTDAQIHELIIYLQDILEDK